MFTELVNIRSSPGLGRTPLSGIIISARGWTVIIRIFRKKARQKTLRRQCDTHLPAGRRTQTDQVYPTNNGHAFIFGVDLREAGRTGDEPKPPRRPQSARRPGTSRAASSGLG